MDVIVIKEIYFSTLLIILPYQSAEFVIRISHRQFPVFIHFGDITHLVIGILQAISNSVCPSRIVSVSDCWRHLRRMVSHFSIINIFRHFTHRALALTVCYRAFNFFTRISTKAICFRAHFQASHGKIIQCLRRIVFICIGIRLCNPFAYRLTRKRSVIIIRIYLLIYLFAIGYFCLRLLRYPIQCVICICRFPAWATINDAFQFIVCRIGIFRLRLSVITRLQQVSSQILARYKHFRRTSFPQCIRGRYLINRLSAARKESYSIL